LGALQADMLVQPQVYKEWAVVLMVDLHRLQILLVFLVEWKAQLILAEHQEEMVGITLRHIKAAFLEVVLLVMW
jgi:hypothetical protein